MSEQYIKTYTFITPPDFKEEFRAIDLRLEKHETVKKVAIRHNDVETAKRETELWHKADCELAELILPLLKTLLELKGATIEQLDSYITRVSAGIIQIRVLCNDSGDDWKE